MTNSTLSVKLSRYSTLKQRQHHGADDGGGSEGTYAFVLSDSSGRYLERCLLVLRKSSDGILHSFSKYPRFHGKRFSSRWQAAQDLRRIFLLTVTEIFDAHDPVTKYSLKDE